MERLKGSQISALKRMAHDLKPVVMIGKLGLTDSALEAVDRALDDHELIKVKFVGFKEEKKALSSLLEEKTEGVLVTLIGNIAVLYRQSRDPNKRKIRI